MERFKPGPQTTILDIGVTSNDSYSESNYFEKLYPYPSQITCVGTEDGSHLMEAYPGLRYLKVVSGEPLPFDSGQFDIVFSNATIEHVGSRGAQAFFVAELCRVSQAYFITTPSRWFPIEHHTGLPFVHFLPAEIFRKIIKNTRYHYWSTETTLNILTAKELKKLFPEGKQPTVKSIRFLGMESNLIAYGENYD